MSGKKKGSLLNRVLGKGKEDEEGGGAKGKKGKKNKLEKQPSIRESVHSQRAPTMHSVTHGSEGALQYEEHGHGPAVTAVHEDDPYSPFNEGASYMGAPSAIHVRPESHATHGGHHSGGDYFEQPFNESPRGTIIHPAGVRELPVEHVETAHPNVINLGEHAHHGHHEPDEHVAFAGVSRQPTILSPHHQASEAPRMLKPGDQMEIDPRNPPTFVVDEGVTLEIGDEEHGFVPYEQYLANLAKQPPPTTGGTYIVQGGGDVVIQDENGDVIKTIPGTGANAGRGEPQIHHPPHIIPVLVSLSRRAAKPRNLRQQRTKHGQTLQILKAPSKTPTGVLDLILEPVLSANIFSSLLDLVDPLPRPEEVNDSSAPTIREAGDSSATIEAVAESKPPMPTRPIPSAPGSPAHGIDLPEDSDQLGQTLPMAEVYSEPPMASPASFEEVEALEEADSDLALVGGTSDVVRTPTMSLVKGIAVDTAVATIFPRSIEGRSPITPADELSDMSEVILSPARSRPRSSDAASRSSTVRSDDFDHHQEVRARPWTSLYGFRGDLPIQSTLDSHARNAVAVPSPPPRPASLPSAPEKPPRQPSLAQEQPSQPPKQFSPTLTHSQAGDVSPDADFREMPYTGSSPPPIPARSPHRPSSRNNSLDVPPLPLPPPLAILRQTHRNPIPIPSATFTTDKSTQPRLNASPKILAMIQKFEGTSRETEDLGNVFVGSTRSLSVSPNSRRGSVSSTKMEYNHSSPWTSYNTPPSSRPDTPDSVSEFGERPGGYNNAGPSNMELAKGLEVRWKGDGRTSDMVNQANWDLQRRGSNTSNTSRPSMTPAIPGWEVQTELIKELSQKRRRRAE